MTIKIIKDVNLDEKVIHTEDDKLTVRVSNNPSNKLTKTENGLEVLLNADDINSSDVYITQEEVNDYINSNYPQYNQTLNSKDLYNPRTRTYKNSTILENIEYIENKYLNLENSTVEYTLSNYEILTPEAFADKYTNNPEYTFDYLKSENYQKIVFLVGDLVVKFKFLKDEFLKDEFLKNILTDNPILAFINASRHRNGNLRYIHLFGYKSLNTEVSEDDSHWYVTLTYDKYAEYKIHSWAGSDYKISNTEENSEYKEHDILPFSIAFKNGSHSVFRVQSTKEVKIDPKLNVPVIIHTVYQG